MSKASDSALLEQLKGLLRSIRASPKCLPQHGWMLLMATIAGLENATNIAEDTKKRLLIMAMAVMPDPPPDEKLPPEGLEKIVLYWVDETLKELPEELERA